MIQKEEDLAQERMIKNEQKAVRHAQELGEPDSCFVFFKYACVNQFN